jgi:NAD(P)-dependent dehydrogenase (short-subunit alcohol dehydrogenase family)
MSKEQVVVVTGAASGIGRAITKKLANECFVIAVDINGNLLRESFPQQENSRGEKKIEFIIESVSELETHFSSVQCARKHGELVGWVNCAGIGGFTPLHQIVESLALADQIYQINQLGTLYGSSVAIKEFLEFGTAGSIVNISSVHGRRAYKDHAVYEMTKAAIDALTRNIAVVYGPYKIRANAIAPGAVLTEAMKQSFIDAPDPSARRDWLETHTPLKRIADPAEIAEVVSFLLFTKSSYITGQSIAVDGGWTSALGLGDLYDNLASKYRLDIKSGLPLD